MTRRYVAALLALAMAAGLAIPGPVAAHETRQVGPYVLVVGWLHEPTYIGLENGAFLSVSDTRNGQPVTGLEQTLEVELRHGAATRRTRLKAIGGRPGAYVADAIPTRGGTYIFRFFGSIGDLALNERFESGPGRFDEPRPLAELEIPPRAASTTDATDPIARGIAIAALLLTVVGVAGVLLRIRRGPTSSR